MPFALMADIAAIIGLSQTIGGPIISHCYKSPGSDRIECRGLHMNQWVATLDPNVGPRNFIQCHNEIQSQSDRVIRTVISPGTVQFDNVPSACMNLGAILIGNCGNSDPRAKLCGSACMKYIGLSDYELRLVSESLNAL